MRSSSGSTYVPRESPYRTPASSAALPGAKAGVERAGRLTTQNVNDTTSRGRGTWGRVMDEHLVRESGSKRYYTQFYTCGRNHAYEKRQLGGDAGEEDRTERHRSMILRKAPQVLTQNVPIQDSIPNAGFDCLAETKRTVGATKNSRKSHVRSPHHHIHTRHHDSLQNELLYLTCVLGMAVC